MTIGEVANILGISVHTLRYYEKIGLIRQVDRVSGKRRYSKANVVWLEFIQRLKRTRMPLEKIRQYADLWHMGDSSIPQRKDMLLAHQQQLLEEMEVLQGHLDFLNKKIDLYETREKSGGSLPRLDEACPTWLRTPPEGD
ncbi:MAG: MerR family transcriptional regulator [Desulfovibrio sp.]|uniref:MerR family transcriptional regulator n=1 Tax=Desulfovibrio sp. 7SRBS1 TaxID=3378064 RepID=UPI003B41795C